jgi:hypothetical protein
VSKPVKVGLILTVLLLLFGGAWLLFEERGARSPPDKGLEEPISNEDSGFSPIPPPTPAPTTSAPASEEGPEAEPTEEPEPASGRPAEPSTPEAPVVESERGTLVFEAQGRKLGEETFKLKRLPTGEVQLTSQGSFLFRVLLVNVQFRYTQEIRWDSALSPRFLALQIKGPLGFGNRSLKVEIDESRRAVITSGEEERWVELPAERLALLGMFSSYVVLPRLIADEERVRLSVLGAEGFGGPRERRDPPPPPVFTVEIVRIDNVSVRSGSIEWEVRRYLLKGADPNSDGDEEGEEGLRLLILDGQLIGVVARSPERGSFQVYRADLFPDGFEIVEDQ